MPFLFAQTSFLPFLFGEKRIFIFQLTVFIASELITGIMSKKSVLKEEKDRSSLLSRPMPFKFAEKGSQLRFLMQEIRKTFAWKLNW